MHYAWMDSGQRLRKAREAAGFRSAAEAAKSLGVQYPTYAGHENGNRGFGGNIDLYARRFGVRGEWLRNGNGAMKPGKRPPIVEEFEGLPAEKQEDVLRFIRFLKAS